LSTQKQKIKNSLNYSILDGAFFSLMTGCGELFFPAYAIFLKANNIFIGILGSLPQTIGYFSQLFAGKMIQLFNSRKRFVGLFVLLQAFVHLPIILVYFCGHNKFIFLLIFVSFYWLFGMLPVPAWNSWMGDLVGEKQRGHYFGRRNKIIGLVNFGAFLGAGLILQNIKQSFWGFVILFLLAFFSRLVSFFWLSLKYDPPHKAQEQTTSLPKIFAELKNKNFQVFVKYQCLMNFALFMAAPFFAPYMLRELQFNYLTYAVTTAAALISKYLAMPIWGRFSDRYGTKRILAITGFLMPLNPLLWILSTNIYWLVLAQIYGGFIWAGFELASFVFVYDITKSAQRTAAIAVNNALNGLAILGGSILGGVLIRYNEVFSSKYYLAFLVSFFLRYLASILFVPRLEEVREVEKIGYRKLIMEIVTAGTTK